MLVIHQQSSLLPVRILRYLEKELNSRELRLIKDLLGSVSCIPDISESSCRQAVLAAGQAKNQKAFRNEVFQELCLVRSPLLPAFLGLYLKTPEFPDARRIKLGFHLAVIGQMVILEESGKC